MGEVVRFVSKSERERARLIREARAIYDSVFPPSDPVRQRDESVAGESHTGWIRRVTPAASATLLM